MPHTHEVLATSRAFRTDAASATIGATAVILALWPTWWFALLVIVASMVLVLQHHRWTHHSTPSEPDLVPSRTAMAWRDAEGDSAVHVHIGSDTHVMVWQRREPEALLSAFGIPAGMAAAYGLLHGFGLLAPYVPMLQDLSESSIQLLATLVMASLYAAALLVTYVVSTPLRRRFKLEEHLLLRGRRAELVSGADAALFSLDDVVAVIAGRGAVQVHLLDGRELGLSTSVPDQLATALLAVVGPLASPEVPQGARQVQALRQAE